MTDMEKIKEQFDFDLKKEIQELKELTLISVKRALTMDDAVLLTGLSKNWLYRLVRERKIPFYKSSCGKFTYFDRDELNGWLLAKRFKTVSEIETEAATRTVARIKN
ncbi:MAG: helix-turn-helix domain-containing protein [Prevotellaceae bacterium]|jgi:excisionase family DNA binding protein|nr:helix-turn-helix domain-containing protein [Prevotellaceae bacterium]